MSDHALEAGNSLIHRLDPRVRILAAFSLSFACALSRELGIISCYLGLGGGLVIMARLSFAQVARRLAPLFWFLVMIWLFLPTTFTEDILTAYGWLTISRAGIMVSAQISLKAIAILLIFSSLIATMPVAALGTGLHQLKVPDKMVFLLLMTYRYIAVIQAEYHRLLRAAKFRGFIPGTNLHSYKTYAFLAGMLFVRASHRAKRVYQAMLCRGFDQKFHTLDHYPPHGLNPWFMGIVLGLTAALILMERFV